MGVHVFERLGGRTLQLCTPFVDWRTRNNVNGVVTEIIEIYQDTLSQIK